MRHYDVLVMNSQVFILLSSAHTCFGSPIVYALSFLGSIIHN